MLRRRAVAAFGTISGFGAFVYTKAKVIADFVAVKDIPKNFEEVAMMASAHPILAFALPLSVGVSCLVCLIYDILFGAKKTANEATQATHWKLKLEPWHVIAFGIVISSGGLIWHVYRPTQASESNATTTQFPSKDPLSADELRFREEIQKFILSYVEEINKYVS
jgi:hypothetical protein